MEAALRLGGYDVPTARPLSRLYTYHPELGWWPRPSVTARFSGADFDTEVAINARRLREREAATYARPGPRQRVLWLGDSALWGWGVGTGERYSDLAAERLGIESINMGQVGYGTDQEVVLYEREGTRYDVDLVVLMVTGSNDLYENLGHGKKPYFRLDPDGTLVPANVPAPDRFRGPGRVLARHSRLAALVTARAAILKLRLAYREDTSEHLASRGISADKVMAGWPVTLALAGHLREAAADRGIPLAIGVIDGAAFGMERLGAWSRSRGVPFLDLNPALRAADPTERQLRLRDGHLNAAGHRWVAAQLAPFLAPLLEPPRAP